ncbi:uncharacterized protein N7500_000880 [Penicillium coprophilum]|uniref:uncharacterized protein n=1 Tax=Penicillium coprophilum TaxID=36646 RepID=UPI00238C4446|nr:uncharacterized protein N7500_000880 [Penicillium coprophilum]KAJ5178181.1 hypothetical protein N7500_000880 [Penicillium coprophilum]
MSALNVDSLPISKHTPNTNPMSPVGHSQYAQKDPEFEPIPIYEGFSFSKAMPEESATWKCVKRTPMHLNQDEYSKLVQKRANKKSTAQQYQSLSSDTQRAHINQLIDEQKHNKPLVEWSFVYVKEHKKLSKARHACRSDHETVTMDVIIMQTPTKTHTYSRAFMNSAEVIRKPYWVDTRNSPMWSHHRQQPLPPDRNGNILQPVLQLLPSKLTPAMVPFANINPTQGPAYPDGQDYSSESDSDSDDASMLSDASDETTATDDLESMETETETECQEPQLNRAPFRQQNPSPHRREPIYGPHLPRKFQSRSLDRRHDRNSHFRDQFEVPPAKGFSPRRTENARSGSVPGKRYRMQLMTDNEIRSRMLDHREASLGHREKWLKKTISEARQLERRQPVKDQPTVCRCTCRCAIKEEREDA